MYRIAKTHATTQPSVSPLPPAERQTLRVICETFLPTLTPEAGDDPDLFALSAESLNVAGAMERSLANLDPAQQQQLRKLLRLLEQPLFIALLIRKLKGFSRLAQADRKRVLLALAISKLEKLRMGFQAVKRLALFLSYSTTDARGVNPAWANIGYEIQERSVRP